MLVMLSLLESRIPRLLLRGSKLVAVGVCQYTAYTRKKQPLQKKQAHPHVTLPMI
ncbi:MAG: hypothetical protein DDT26_01507 [Dehalococcoidia bacterium]|nr:hypothetical protein [Chloroflexota bacterium]